MKNSVLKILAAALVAVSLTGCASGGMYNGGSNLAMKTVGGALIGTAIGGLTSSSNDVRDGMRQGAAYGAAAGGIFAAGENYGAAQARNAKRRAQYRSRYK